MLEGEHGRVHDTIGAVRERHVPALIRSVLERAFQTCCFVDLERAKALGILRRVESYTVECSVELAREVDHPVTQQIARGAYVQRHSPGLRHRVLSSYRTKTRREATGRFDLLREATALG